MSYVNEVISTSNSNAISSEQLRLRVQFSLPTAYSLRDLYFQRDGRNYTNWNTFEEKVIPAQRQIDPDLKMWNN